MRILECELTLHDTVFFATREVGRLYETEKYLHNYALTYALGLAVSPYTAASTTPAYKEHLTALNARGIYVTPAEPLHYDFVIATFKLGDVRYHAQSEQSTTNRVSFGRAKELSPGSTFRFFVLSQEPWQPPRWIRLGKWLGKAEVRTMGQWEVAMMREGTFSASCPLNPLDLAQLPTVFDLVSMPPVSLLTNARGEGVHYVIERDRDRWHLPAGMAYLTRMEAS